MNNLSVLNDSPAFPPTPPTHVRIFYEFYAETRVGGEWLCVVVKYLPDDAFVITAYLTDSVKAGEILWPKN